MTLKFVKTTSCGSLGTSRVNGMIRNPWWKIKFTGWITSWCIIPIKDQLHKSLSFLFREWYPWKQEASRKNSKGLSPQISTKIKLLKISTRESYLRISTRARLLKISTMVMLLKCKINKLQTSTKTWGPSLTTYKFRQKKSLRLSMRTYNFLIDWKRLWMPQWSLSAKAVTSWFQPPSSLSIWSSLKMSVTQFAKTKPWVSSTHSHTSMEICPALSSTVLTMAAHLHLGTKTTWRLSRVKATS